MLVPLQTNASYKSIWRTKTGNHLIDSAEQIGPRLGPAAGIFPHSTQLPKEVVRNRAVPELRRSVTVYVPAPSLWHEPTIFVPTKDTDPLKPLLPQQPDAEGDVHAGKREVPQSPQRPACRASLLPAAIPGALRDLAARSRLRISPQGGQRQRDDLLTGAGAAAGRGPRGAGPGGVWGREAPPLPEGLPPAALPGPHPARGRWRRHAASREG